MVLCCLRWRRPELYICIMHCNMECGGGYCKPLKTAQLEKWRDKLKIETVILLADCLLLFFCYFCVQRFVELNAVFYCIASKLIRCLSVTFHCFSSIDFTVVRAFSQACSSCMLFLRHPRCVEGKSCLITRFIKQS